jgi:hypothetical protein
LSENLIERELSTNKTNLGRIDFVLLHLSIGDNNKSKSEKILKNLRAPSIYLIQIVCNR